MMMPRFLDGNLEKISAIHNITDTVTQGDDVFATFMIPDNHQPNDINALNNGLISYFLVLSIIEDALLDFAHKKYRSFDALIGNNSCYVCSYIVFLIARRYSIDNLLQEETININEKITQIKQKIIKLTNSFENSVKSDSLFNFINENDLALNLDQDIIYLAMAYACTLAKCRNSSEFEETNYENLIAFYNRKINFNLRRKTTQKLIKHWQKTLSILNIKTLQNHAKDVQCEKTRLWANYISNDEYILEDSRGRLCAPSLYSAALIYEKLSKIPGSILGLQVNIIRFPKDYISRFTLFFQVLDDGSLKSIAQDELSYAEPVYMFTGCRYISDDSLLNIDQMKDSFQARDLKTLILAHEVTYPQYPKSLNAENIIPLEEELVKKIGNLKTLQGFSLEDPTDLCLVHIFVDDTLTQSLAHFEPAIYLPQLNDYEDYSKSSS